MLDNNAPNDHEIDALHVLRLSKIRPPGRRKARIAKYARLVEPISSAVTGSGQFTPDELPWAAKFEGRNNQGLETVLSKLPSHDVYGLRIGLRRLDIDVDDC